MMKKHHVLSLALLLALSACGLGLVTISPKGDNRYSAQAFAGVSSWAMDAATSKATATCTDAGKKFEVIHAETKFHGVTDSDQQLASALIGARHDTSHDYEAIIDFQCH